MKSKDFNDENNFLKYSYGINIQEIPHEYAKKITDIIISEGIRSYNKINDEPFTDLTDTKKFTCWADLMNFSDEDIGKIQKSSYSIYLANMLEGKKISLVEAVKSTGVFMVEY